MNALPSELRKLLEKTIIAARVASESGARKALESLAAHHHEPWPSMSPTDRELRNRLRAHGRQLGDARDSQKGAQSIDRLVQECAYEHWHRMLFARFLAENGLLLDSATGVAVSLEECAELARDKGQDPWQLAGTFAERMLPQIFRQSDPALAVVLPRETRVALEKRLTDLPAAIFTADDSLGWTYQFWQSAEKVRVNDRVKAGEKITGATLPAVTQLFTEHYMVLFLLHNTVGAWWASRQMAGWSDAEHAACENELAVRKAVALEDYEFEYLRFVRDDATKRWRPAAGSFETWPKETKQLRVLDPCCGSGHFLVAVLDLLARLRRVEEGLDVEDAIRAVLTDNLFGLELDARCTQIAAFALALHAWKTVGRVCVLPPMHIACCGMAPYATETDWAALADRAAAAAGMPVRKTLFLEEPSLASAPLRNALSALHQLFSAAPELGALIDPRSLPKSLYTASFADVEPLLAAALKNESPDEAIAERTVAAQGMAKAAEILAGRYTLIITNPPFLGIEKQTNERAKTLASSYPVAKRELGLCLLERSVTLVSPGGASAFVLPGEWTFVRSYRKFRQWFLRTAHIRVLAHLGSNAFVEPLRAIPILLISTIDDYARRIATCLNVETESLDRKPRLLANGTFLTVPQQSWNDQADCRLLCSIPKVVDTNKVSIGSIADCRNGLSAGDGSRFELFFWEIDDFASTWETLQSSTDTTRSYGGRSKIVRWENEAGAMYELAESVKDLNHAAQNWRRGKPLWGRRGVIVNQIGAHTTIYDGQRYDSSCFAVVPNDDSDVNALIAFALQGELRASLRVINPTWNLKSPKTLLQLEINIHNSAGHFHTLFPEGLPGPETDSAEQWLFSGNPRSATSGTVLQVAFARIVGYRWPAERDPTMRLAPSARALADGCKTLEKFADDDGVVTLVGIRGGTTAERRLRELLTIAFGDAWTQTRENELLAAAAKVNDKEGRVPNLNEWLKNHFFPEHCTLFNHLPFIWHIWDGRDDGFQILVNYHKLAAPGGAGRRLLEKITNTYLGEWIERQRAEQREGREGSDARLAAAQTLQIELERILKGEPPYDIFVRWKPLAEQSIGWDPDINDGVRLNIRPFLMAKDVGKKGAGILRAKPNIKWGKDRGAEPKSIRPKEQFPWFWGCDPEKNPSDQTDFKGGKEFTGVRWNDLHYTNAMKRAARGET